MDQYTITSFKIGGLEIERPPVASRHAAPTPRAIETVDDTMKEALGITSPEDYEFHLNNLDRALND